MNLIVTLFAPFFVLKYEKSYLFWVVGIGVFGLINVWGGLLLKGCSTLELALLDGTGYIFSISICAPQIVENLIRFLVEKKKAVKTHFLGYKIVSIIFAFFMILCSAFLWSGVNKQSFGWQVIVVMSAIFISFYVYCINQMEQYKKLIESYDDKEYDYVTEENEKVKILGEESKKTEEVTIKTGDRIQL